MRTSDPGCDRLLAEFLDSSIDPRAFSHLNHVQVAWALLTRQPFDQALTMMDSGLRRLVAKHGIAGKYHATITTAMMRLVYAGMRAARGPETWENFLTRNPELTADARRLLKRHYSDELLMSDTARAAFVAPDRAALPKLPSDECIRPPAA